MSHELALVTIPTLNERENLDWFMEGILALKDDKLHVLVADDDSLDGTWRTYGTKYAADSEKNHLIRRPGHDKGQGYALRDAWKWALEHQPAYAYVIAMAGNRTDDPRYIPQMIAALQGGADMVVCERSLAPGADASAPRRTWGGRALIGAPASVKDYESGFRGFTRAALEKINPKRLRSGDHGLKAEVMARAGKLGLRVATVPVPFVAKDPKHEQGGNAGFGGKLGLFVRRVTGGL
jgi:dolichol-phosphate mannosyltransferase